MLSATEALDLIVKDMRAMKVNETSEAALSTNKPWVSAQSTKVKRDAPGRVPSEGELPETFFSLAERKLHAMATLIHTYRLCMDRGELIGPESRAAQSKARGRLVLSEVDVDPVEVAFLFGYTSDKPVRERRIRNGLDEHTGFPLKDAQRPIISNRKRARR